jgi:hypothetical protein
VPVRDMPHRLDRWMYAGGRPNGLAHFLNRRAVLVHGDREPILLHEIAVPERPAVLKRYLQLAPGARAHIPVDPGAPISAFEAVAPDYPVFRVETT